MHDGIRVIHVFGGYLQVVVAGAELPADIQRGKVLGHVAHAVTITVAIAPALQLRCFGLVACVEDISDLAVALFEIIEGRRKITCIISGVHSVAIQARTKPKPVVMFTKKRTTISICATIVVHPLPFTISWRR